MKIRVGFEIKHQFPQRTPMLVMLRIHDSRAGDLIEVDHLVTEPPVDIDYYRDSFGNLCGRLLAPAGELTIRASALVEDSGEADAVNPDAEQHPIEELPAETLVYLLGSRYCETDLLSNTAWQLFGGIAPGWARVEAISEYVHRHIAFGYQHGRPTKTALDAWREGNGVCRDYAHLGIALCRAMNIPARYCSGYLGDIGVTPLDAPMDFAGWFEAYLGGRWYTFDPRNRIPRIGRVLMTRGRDATDVALTNTFGPNLLTGFKVITDEVR
jgi:transglutaminase-like putative cysteine protease